MRAFYASTIGKKVLVAVSGALLVAFVIGHMLGNLKLFLGFDAHGAAALDHYAEFLRSAGEELFGRGGLLWIVRLALLLAVSVHIVLTVQLWLRNRGSQPRQYERRRYLMATVASRTMFWGGFALVLFIVLHILHLSTGTIVSRGFVPGRVYANVYRAFSVPYVTAAYIAAMAVLALHIYHGAWSMFQTLGFDDPGRNRALRAFAAGAAAVLFIGFVSVPLAVAAGLVSAPPGAFAGGGDAA